MTEHWSAALERLGACGEAVEWCRTQPDAQTAWERCEREDWMLWLLGCVGWPAGARAAYDAAMRPAWEAYDAAVRPARAARAASAAAVRRPARAYAASVRPAIRQAVPECPALERGSA